MTISDLSGAGRAIVLVSLLGIAVAMASASFLPVVVVFPAVMALIWAVIAWEGHGVTVSVDYSNAVFLEGDDVRITVWVSGARGVSLIRIVTDADSVFDSVEFVMRPGVDGRCSGTRTLTVRRFGTHRAKLSLDVCGMLGLILVSSRMALDQEVRVYPRFGSEEFLQGLSPRGFGVGRHSSRARGPGHDFVGIRPAFPGESLRSVNWRLTARSGSIWVNERQPERPLDIVIFLDTFSDAGISDGARIASDVARSHLGAHDTVGLVLYGGTLGWIPLGSGAAHLESMLSRLMRARSFPSVSEKSYRLVPSYVLPRRARVIAVSNLADERGRRALLDMTHDGYSVDLIRIPVPPASGEASRLEALLSARDLSLLRRSGVIVREVLSV